MMDLGAVLAELKAVDDFKQTDKNLATASFCQRACKVSYGLIFMVNLDLWREAFKQYSPFLANLLARTHFSCTLCSCGWDYSLLECYCA